MMEKKPTVASLLRKIKKLEARLVVSESRLDDYIKHYRADLYARADANTRIEQAMAILRGEE